MRFWTFYSLNFAYPAARKGYTSVQRVLIKFQFKPASDVIYAGSVRHMAKPVPIVRPGPDPN
jgi:hypothetical protein